MVKTILKGRRSQAKVRKMLENKGYLVYFIHHTRFSKDIFGLFDGFYIYKKKVVFFQVKSNIKPVLKPFEVFHDKFGVQIHIFIVKDKKGIEEVFLP